MMTTTRLLQPRGQARRLFFQHMTLPETPQFSTTVAPADAGEKTVLDRESVLKELIQQGIDIFADAMNPSVFPHGAPRYNVLNWLFMTCMSRGLVLQPWESAGIVEQVSRSANRLLNPKGHTLTVGELRQRLASLNEDMPVVYERIEDVCFENRGWTTEALSWPTPGGSTQELTDELREMRDRGELPNTRVVLREGKEHLEWTSEFIPAFGAYVGTDVEGRRALCVYASY